MGRILQSTDIKGALAARKRQQGFIMNPFRFGGGGPSIDTTYSVLVAAFAVTGTSITAYGIYNIANTHLTDYAKYWSEYGSGAVHSYVTSTMGDTGVLSTKTLAIDISRSYRLEAYNGNGSPSDLCPYAYEFLNASNSVVCAVHSTGTGSFLHNMRYGASLASYSTASVSGSYPQTTGNLTFESTLVRYTNTRGSNYNASWTYTCAASTITQIRISAVRARNAWSGNPTIVNVLLRKNAP